MSGDLERVWLDAYGTPEAWEAEAYGTAEQAEHERYAVYQWQELAREREREAA